MKGFYTWILGILFLGLVQSASAQLQLQGHLGYSSPSEDLSNLWSYTAPDGHKYALVGNGTGLSIVDIQNPTTPTELFQIVWNNSIWREVKTYRDHAYVTTEGGGGVMIVDLSGLPAAAPYTYFTDGGALDAIHALHVDTAYARLYLYGANGTSMGDGALVYSLSDPTAPVFIGQYQNNGYVHDGEARNNVLYASHIYDGFVSICDMTIPSSPVVLGTVTTPTSFSHNTWLNDAGTVMFTSDENNNSYFGAFDITDPTDIRLLDKVQLPFVPDSGGIVHNVYVYNDFLVASYYVHGIVVIDAHEPDELVITEHYDTSPYNGNNFNGVWGVCPYYQDSTIIASDIEQGLFVFKCGYHRASYLSGHVTDAVTTAPISNVNVTISSLGETRTTDMAGFYKMGLSMAGTYSITFSAFGYTSQTMTATFAEGVINTLDVQLDPIASITLAGSVLESNTSIGVSHATVILTNGIDTISTTADSNGVVGLNPFYTGTYTIIASQWGHVTTYIPDVVIDGVQPFTIYLPKGYYDDFISNMNWVATATAVSGAWERGEPMGTNFTGMECNPELDVATDMGDLCYMTQNGGGAAGDFDVDNGSVILSSPNIDLSSYNDPYISFSTWFFNGGGTSTPNDSLKVTISNGDTSVVLYQIGNGSSDESTWKNTQLHLNSLIGKTSTMTLQVRATDATPGHLVEGGFDAFSIVDSMPTSILEPTTAEILIYPNPAHDFIEIKNQNHETWDVEISDINGKCLLSQKSSDTNHKIMIQMLNPGLYFIKLTYGKSYTKVQKFVKE